MKTKTIFSRFYYSVASMILLAAILVGCENSEQRSRYVCNCQQLQELQSFVKGSIKDANNMSDEEMEDVIHQLRIDGMKIYCKQKPVWVNTTNMEVDWTKQKIDSCDVIMDNW